MFTAEGAEESDRQDLTGRIIGAAIEIHKTIGPGLLESAYEECIAHEMKLRGLNFDRPLSVSVVYKGAKLDCGYRVGFLAEEAVVLELKAVEAIQPIHEARLLTCPKLGGWIVGLLINFNVPVLKSGIRRVVLNYKEPSACSAPPR